MEIRWRITMQIFAIHSDPEICASLLDDKRLNKMCSETAQILSASIDRVTRGTFPDNPQVVLSDYQYPIVGFQKWHVNHPCVVWCSSCFWSYKWTCNLLLELNAEFTKRYNKSHATHKYIGPLLAHLYLFEHNPGLEDQFVLVIPQGMEHVVNQKSTVHVNYVNLLLAKWELQILPPKMFGAPICKEIINLLKTLHYEPRTSTYGEIHETLNSIRASNNN